MKIRPDHFVRLIVGIAHPLLVFSVILAYALGGGIAKYLGVKTDWSVYFWGQIWVITLLIGTYFINFYFEKIRNPGVNSEPDGLIGREELIPGLSISTFSLFVGLACYTAVVPVTLLMLSSGYLNIPVGFWMVFSIILSILFILPPFRIIDSGYGELFLSIFVAFWVPLFSFLLQYGEYNNIVLFISLPLLTNFLAMLIAIEFRNYSTDITYGKANLLTRMGWRNGVVVLVVSIILSIILPVAIYFLGFPRFVVVSDLVILPFGVVYLWLVFRITSGAKPLWGVFTFTGISFFILMVYLFAFGFWTG